LWTDGVDVHVHIHPVERLARVDAAVPVVQVVQLTGTSTYDGRPTLPAAQRETIIPT